MNKKRRDYAWTFYEMSRGRYYRPAEARRNVWNGFGACGNHWGSKTTVLLVSLARTERVIHSRIIANSKALR